MDTCTTDEINRIKDAANSCGDIPPKELWKLKDAVNAYYLAVCSKCVRRGMIDGSTYMPIEAESRIKHREECPYRGQLERESVSDYWCPRSATYCDFYAECDRMGEYDDGGKPLFKVEEQ